MSTQLTRNRTFLGLRARAWTISLPLHLIAFAVLYISAVHLTQSEVFSTASEVARATLAHEVKEFANITPAPGALAGLDTLQPHGDFFTAHEGTFEIALYTVSGQSVTSNAIKAPPPVVQDFLHDNMIENAWLATVGDRFVLKSLRRIEAQAECAACHQLGELLGVLSAELDLTPQIQRVRERLRRNLAILLVGWAAAITFFGMLVERTIRRSARTLQADLNAAEVGEYSATDKDNESAILDPVAADLHHSLREFLRRRSQRESELASRMVHTDQLASVGQLAAGLAHEIKNPLAGVSCALELLQEQVRDEAQKTRCAVILEELGRIDQTLGLLLSSARPAPLQIVDADLRRLLDDIRRFLTPALRRRKIQLKVELASDVANACVDASKIRQVLVNLINNAADAIEHDGQVTVRAARFPAGDGLVITVEDNGPGISDDDKKKIFTPFFTTKLTGTGLGLTIAVTIVEQHKGRLDVHTTPGHGTTFVMVLPQPVKKLAPRTDNLVVNSLCVATGD